MGEVASGRLCQHVLTQESSREVHAAGDAGLLNVRVDARHRMEYIDQQQC